ncbi:MAG: hypothetical protein JRJ20_00275 [Deltaproteobacteria bacterium]|nr:hypothetical protein [Deltaproteobacteria bacterium]
MKLLLRLGIAAIALFSLLIAWQEHDQGRAGFLEVEPAGFSHPSSSSNAPVSIPIERVAHRMEGLNGFAWNYAYDLRLKDNKLVVSVGINLIPARGVTRPEIERVEPFWEKGIEQIWSEKFALETISEQRYPVVVDVSFKGPEFHHDVIVRPGSGGTDELNWNILDNPKRVAHEFGHMIGLFDEYERGALAPQNAVIDSGSIMTSNPGEGAMARERHFEPFRRWFIGKTMMSNVRIIHEKANHE